MLQAKKSLTWIVGLHRYEEVTSSDRGNYKVVIPPILEDSLQRSGEPSSF